MASTTHLPKVCLDFKTHAQMPDKDNPTAEQLRHFISAEIKAWMQYVLHSVVEETEFHNGVRDRGRSEGTCLKDFIAHANAKQARSAVPA